MRKEQDDEMAWLNERRRLDAPKKQSYLTNVRMINTTVALDQEREQRKEREKKTAKRFRTEWRRNALGA